MFEITYSDNETFEAYQNAGKAHKGGTYDFTLKTDILFITQTCVIRWITLP